jgi:hypothetical protein
VKAGGRKRREAVNQCHESQWLKSISSMAANNLQYNDENENKAKSRKSKEIMKEKA